MSRRAVPPRGSGRADAPLPLRLRPPRARRGLATLASVAILGAGAVLPVSAAGETPGLAEARQATLSIAEEIDALETRVGELEQEIAELDATRERLEAERAELRDDVERLAVEQYTQGGSEVVFDPDPDRRLRAEALADSLSQADFDALERYRGVAAQLDATNTELDARRAELDDSLAAAQERQEQLAAELARLEALELERLAEERRRAEAQARAAEEAAARRAAQQRAARLAAEEAARREVREAIQSAPAASSAASTPVVTVPAPAAPPPSGGGMVCPVPGSVFRDGFGDPRPGGRMHTGIDMVAPEGTPILAPVSGTVVHGGDALGGNTFNLAGDDGRGYYGAHLSAYGASGRVTAGTVVGYVGNTGHSYGAHLHIQITVGGSIINPYPDLVAAC